MTVEPITEETLELLELDEIFEAGTSSDKFEAFKTKTKSTIFRLNLLKPHAKDDSTKDETTSLIFMSQETFESMAFNGLIRVIPLSCIIKRTYDIDKPLIEGRYRIIIGEVGLSRFRNEINRLPDRNPGAALRLWVNEKRNKDNEIPLGIVMRNQDFLNLLKKAEIEKHTPYLGKMLRFKPEGGGSIERCGRYSSFYIAALRDSKPPTLTPKTQLLAVVENRFSKIIVDQFAHLFDLPEQVVSRFTWDNKLIDGKFECEEATENYLAAIRRDRLFYDAFTGELVGEAVAYALTPKIFQNLISNAKLEKPLESWFVDTNWLIQEPTVCMSLPTHAAVVVVKEMPEEDTPVATDNIQGYIIGEELFRMLLQKADFFCLEYKPEDNPGQITRMKPAKVGNHKWWNNHRVTQFGIKIESKIQEPIIRQRRTGLATRTKISPEYITDSHPAITAQELSGDRNEAHIDPFGNLAQVAAALEKDVDVEDDVEDVGGEEEEEALPLFDQLLNE